jgi:hypothetical protein
MRHPRVGNVHPDPLITLITAQTMVRNLVGLLLPSTMRDTTAAAAV